MSTRTWIMALAAVGLVSWFGGGAFSDEKPAPGAGAQPGSKEFEQEMEALGAPGEMHARLAKFDGTWSVTGFFSEPDGTKMETTGTATCRMVLGGRFSEQVYSGQMKGKSFDGRGMTGYDNLSKQFENFWFDTMGTTPSVARGAPSADGKTMEMAGEWAMPGGSKMAFKFVTTWLSADSFRFEIIMDVGGGTMVPVGVLTYTRTAAPACK